MSQKIDIFMTLKWTSDDGKRSLTVDVVPANDMYIRYECSGPIEDQLLELDEHAWHALYEMMGEVKP